MEDNNTTITFYDGGDPTVGIFPQSAFMVVPTMGLDPCEKDEFISALKQAISDVLKDWEWAALDVYTDEELAQREKFTFPPSF